MTTSSTSPISSDTICAIATPHGIGGIAVVRLSGPQAIEIAGKIWQGTAPAIMQSHTVHLGHIIDPSTGDTLDQAVATIFRAPKSYTGDDTVEFSVHGSEWIQSQLIQLLIANGARLAEPGEYTRRAFAAGHLDLAEAEAVADLIASKSRAAHRIAINQMRGGFSKRLTMLRERLLELASLLELELDFSEEDVEFASREQLRTIASEVLSEVTRLHQSFRHGAAIKNGIPVAIVGPTNAGKSSLLNALLGEDRAIVSNIHGTTRDTVEDTLMLGDYLFRFIDTAGLRHTTDEIEKMGIDRSLSAINTASIIINVIDPTQPTTDNTLRHRLKDINATIVNIVNKTDITTPDQISSVRATLSGNIIELSAKKQTGVEALTETLTDIAQKMNGNDEEQIMVSNIRHAEALSQAATSTARIIDGIDNGLPGDLIAQDLRETLHTLGAITGAITTPDILSTVFSRFCIGK